VLQHDVHDRGHSRFEGHSPGERFEGLDFDEIKDEYGVLGAWYEFVADAAGWKVRVEVLERDLTETPENGIATIMADEHFNV
jgi:hypothetical protein